MTRRWNLKGKLDRTHLVGLAVVTYEQPNQLRALTGCLLCQTYPHFVARAYHDGPASPGVKEAWGVPGDARFEWVETPKRENCYGHTNRRLGLNELTSRPEVSVVGTTNADNLYAPVYLEAMVEAFRTGADFAYCDMVHSHRRWEKVTSVIRRKFIDAGNWLVRADIARKIQWDKTDFAADWDYVHRITSLAKAHRKIPACLFMHN